MARWQSGYAADCNSVYAGSIPTRASTLFKFGSKLKSLPALQADPTARVVELVDTGDLKSPDR